MLIKIFKKIFKKIFSKEKIYIYISLGALPNINRPNNYKIVRANLKNLKDILFFQEKKYIKIFETFLKNGDRGYLGYLNENCVHRTWVKSNCQTINFHRYFKYKLKKDEEYIHYCETSDKARNKGCFSFTLNQILSENFDKKKLIAVNSKNLSSIKAIERSGFDLYKTIIIYRILFLTIKK